MDYQLVILMTHKFGKQIILGGVKIDYHLGLVGHSDADCVLHVVCESSLVL